MRRNSFFLISILGAWLLAGCREKPMVNAIPANLPAAIAQAKAENKLLLIEFGSSDSCTPCILLEEKVFSQPEFKTYAVSNLVFLRIDFPAKSKLPTDVEATNILLASQFDAMAWPTFVAFDKDGKEFWRMPEKNDPNPGMSTSLFNPQGFIALLDAVKQKQK